MIRITGELIAILILSAFAIATIFCGIQYILTFYSLLVSYDKSVVSVLKYLGLVFAHELKSNYTSSYTFNTTKFYVIYFSLNASEMDNTLNHANTLLTRLNDLTPYVIFIILFYVFYLLFYFVIPCDLIRHPLAKRIFEYASYFLGLFIVLIFGSSSAITVIMVQDVFLSLSYSLIHLEIPLNVIVSIPEILIFGLDLAMFLVVFISEYAYKVSENLAEKIKAFISDQNRNYTRRVSSCINSVKFIPVLAYLSNIFNDAMSILIKIYAIIGLTLTIGMSLLAYYNEAFLVLDIFLSISSISILVSFASVNISLNLLLYFYAKILEMNEFMPKLL